ncbi:MAG: hypothetical protein AAB427_07600, partial [Chloroflexota bacterium]
MNNGGAHSVSGLNSLSEGERFQYVRHLIPPALFERYGINPETFRDSQGRLLLTWVGAPGATS